MIVKFFNRVLNLYRQILSSIGFWPSIITLLYGVAAALLLWIDTTKLTTFLLEKAPGLVIRDGDTARIILSTLVGGLVSLTVFSFTMVMAQLNSAATSYSPRLLPGLISTKSHQVVLGTFLGSIAFSLLVLITIEPSEDSYGLPGLAILVAVALSIGCLGTFVYFIHAISQAIQVTRILQRIANQSELRMKQLEDHRQRKTFQGRPDVELKYTVNSPTTGYFQEVNVETLKNLAIKHDLIVEVIPLQGEFILENTKALRFNTEPDEEIVEEMLSCFRFSGDSYVTDNYVLGFKHITEIAVRAMSPGTNDPGTALTAIEHLTQLIALRLRFDDEEIYDDKDGNPCLIVSVVTLSDLLFPILAALRLYCKHDIIIMLQMLRMFDYLLQQPAEKQNYIEILKSELETLIADARASIESEADKAALEKRIKALRIASGQ